MKHFKNWLTKDEADPLLALALSNLTWEIRNISLFGKTIPQPRLVSHVGKTYTYSKLNLEERPIPWWAEPILHRISEIADTSFNSILFNRYRSGKDSISWHSDNEKELGPDPVIASLSLGASRKFFVRRVGSSRGFNEFTLLEHGDLLIMSSGFQKAYQHAIPKVSHPVGERISLTFRLIS